MNHLYGEPTLEIHWFGTSPFPVTALLCLGPWGARSTGACGEPFTNLQHHLPKDQFIMISQVYLPLAFDKVVDDQNSLFNLGFYRNLEPRSVNWHLGLHTAFFEFRHPLTVCTLETCSQLPPPASFLNNLSAAYFAPQSRHSGPPLAHRWKLA